MSGLGDQVLWFQEKKKKGQKMMPIISSHTDLKTSPNTYFLRFLRVHHDSNTTILSAWAVVRIFTIHTVVNTSKSLPIFHGCQAIKTILPVECQAECHYARST